MTSSDGFISIGNDDSRDLGPVLGFRGTIADVWREEDAHLIAAAPNLLEALKGAVASANPKTRVFSREGVDEKGEAVSELCSEDMWPEWVITARAAIAKASPAPSTNNAPTEAA